MIRLTLEPPDPADNPLARLEARLPGILRQGLEQAARTGLAASRELLRGGLGPQSRSGRLAGSLGYRLSGGGPSWQAELYSDAPYAAVQEFGARIQARRAQYLKFKVEGRWVQVKRVTIPARPFLRPGAEAAALALEQEITRALMEELS